MVIIEAKTEMLRTDVPSFSAGDFIKVFQRIKEGDKERIQVFEGLVIGRHGNKGISSTFTVRKIASGVGVERIFPLHTPSIAKIELVRRGTVRKAKLYYVKERQDNQPRYRTKKQVAKK
jgi:large subunit ribosomal protein L19